MQLDGKTFPIEYINWVKPNGDFLMPTDTFEKAQEKLGDTARSEEDVLSYALFPQVAEKFFKARQAAQLGLDNSVLDTKNNAMPI